MTAESARLCPQCGGELECDMVDIGVGEMQDRRGCGWGVELFWAGMTL